MAMSSNKEEENERKKIWLSSKEARLSPQISRQQRVSVGQGKENENQGQESVKISTAEEDICRKNQNVEAQSRIACIPSQTLQDWNPAQRKKKTWWMEVHRSKQHK